MKRQLLLGLVVSFELSNDLTHPLAVVTPLPDNHAVVHHLDRYAAALRHFTSAWDLWDAVSVAHRYSQFYPPPFQIREALHGGSVLRR